MAKDNYNAFTPKSVSSWVVHDYIVNKKMLVTHDFIYFRYSQALSDNTFSLKPIKPFVVLGTRSVVIILYLICSS